METTETSEDLRPLIPEPNLDNLDPWLKTVVDQAAEGYKTASDSKGAPLSPEEQLNRTRQQYIDMVYFHRELRQSDNERMRSHALDDKSLKKEIVAAVRLDKVSTKFR